MRDANIPREPGLPEGGGTLSGKADPGTQNGLDGILRLLAGMESTLAAVQERVGRLEADARHLRSQNANRA